MVKKGKGRLSALLLLMVLCFTGCSAAELLTEIPETMQVEKSAAPPVLQDGPDGNRTGEEPAGSGETGQQTSSFLMEEAVRFAYQRLSAEEQLWYQDIQQALGNMEDEVRLSDAGLDAGLDESCIDRIFQCVLNDHPEIFYVEGYTYTKYSRGVKPVAIAFSGNYQMTREEAEARKKEIEQAAQGILDNAKPQASEYDKVKYVYETLIRSTEYDLNAPDNQNIYSVFVGGASVCQGYAKATQYLLNRLGVECTLVQGKVDNGEGHAWNLVRVDGSYYYVDTTWGDASYQREDGQDVDAQFFPEINYDYLCVTTEQLLRTHMLENVVPMPECTDTAANYYVRQGAFFESYDREQMQRLFDRAWEEQKQDVTVKCADGECYRQIRNALIEEQEIFDYLPQGENNVSYAHNEKQLSLTFWVTNQ